MSNFNLEGRLNVANALVGTFRNDELAMDHTLVVALVPEGIAPKDVREMQDQILLEARAKFVPWDHGRAFDYTDLFNRLSAHQLSLKISDASPAAGMIDVALKQSRQKNVIYCTNTAAYLSVCSKLGLSAREMTSVAELNALMPRPIKTVSHGNIVGLAHKVCGMLATGRGNYMMAGEAGLPPLDHDIRMDLADKMKSAVKFQCGDFNSLDDRTVKAADDIIAGQRKFYLPYDSCLFECDLDGQKILLLANKNKHPGMRASNGKSVGLEDFLVLPIAADAKKDWCSVAPLMIVFHVDKGRSAGLQLHYYLSEEDDPAGKGSSKVRERFKEAGLPEMSRIVVMALALFNSPSHRQEIVSPPLEQAKRREKKIKNDPHKFPFFDYHVLRGSEGGQENLADLRLIRAQSALEGESGIRQRFHRRSGHYRVTARETIWIDDYFAGDPALGIIGKSRAVSPEGPR